MKGFDAMHEEYKATALRMSAAATMIGQELGRRPPPPARGPIGVVGSDSCPICEPGQGCRARER